MPCEDRGRDWSDVAISQGTPEITRNTKARKWQRRILSQKLHRECGPAGTLISDF